VVDKLGDEVRGWNVGQRVGVGWSGGHGEVTGLSVDGGYAEYMVAYTDSMVRIPDGLSAVEAAPLMCAGVTTFDALRNSGARMGDLVAIQGIGGLGHLAVQYARNAGFHTVAISRGAQKKALALELGAHAYIDTEVEDAAKVLHEMGGAKVILATAPNAKAISQLVGGLKREGALVCVAGEGAPMQVSPVHLLDRRTIKGWVAAGAPDIQDTINFSVLTNVHPMIETFPLTRAVEALEHMLKADVRFRAVLTMG
jgi:propanol-preferring alcohol dehydrogenase